jgi:Zn ribbon nucleic-acid-binding protein
MDRLQVLEVDGQQVRRCVACGYEDDLSTTASQAPTNRLDGGLKKPLSEAGSPVRILDPGARHTPKKRHKGVKDTKDVSED